MSLFADNIIKIVIIQFPGVKFPCLMTMISANIVISNNCPCFERMFHSQCIQITSSHVEDLLVMKTVSVMSN